jgi:type I restriction enzyme S subunit
MITAVDCTIIRFNKLQVLPEFFVNYSRSNTYLRAIRAVTTGTTRDRVSRSNLGRVSMPVPALAEQRRVVKDLAAVEAEVRQLESIYTRKLAALDALKQSLLQQAFSEQF